MPVVTAAMAATAVAAATVGEAVAMALHPCALHSCASHHLRLPLRLWRQSSQLWQGEQRHASHQLRFQERLLLIQMLVQILCHPCSAEREAEYKALRL